MGRQLNRRAFVAGGLFTTASAAAAVHAGDGIGSARAGGKELSARLQSYLWQQQQRDGSWRSATYGLLRSGQSLTPFVLLALMEADQVNSEDDRAANAIRWIRKQLRRGCLGVVDPDVLEYPVYSTSLALRSFELHREAHAETDAMRGYLFGEQFAEHRGFDTSGLAYGGWGFGGLHPPGETGHMDLAHTRWALQALETSGSESAAIGVRAQRLLRLLQKHPEEDRVQPLDDQQQSADPRFDGGFYFSPIVLGANKGRIERAGGRAYFRSYATATCDGALALLAAGVDRGDDRVVAARRWLQSHPEWEYPAGIPRDYHEPWGGAVYFYHQAVRAEAYRRLEISGDWAAKLIRRIGDRAGADGSLVNDNALMKENDPILCTTLALRAVTEAIRAIRKT